MVIWEITLGTAYFLGLKRTYRLALRIQRRLTSPNQPKVRRFLHRRTRAIFNVARKVHKSIQERDIEVGRNLGNWILRWRDRMKPSAQIRGAKLPASGNVNTSTTNSLTDSSNLKTPTSLPTFNVRSGDRSGDREADRHNFTSSSNIWRKPFPPIAMMMRAAKPVGNNTQCRHFSICSGEAFNLNCRRYGSEGVIRKDIMQWMLRN